ncbi:MAG: HEAT repeat domain-containing protein [Clostridiales bacterium]|nr:HEAT repeat domain-containing protein [Clostridiales bacterium]
MRELGKKAADREYEYLLALEESDAVVLYQANIDRVLRSLQDGDEDLRWQATRLAGFYYNAQFEPPLLRRLRDWRMIIRVEACDSLSNSDNMEVCRHIRPLMRHCHPLERGYALLGYSDIVCNAGASKEQALRILRPRFAAEKDAWVRVFGIEALAQLGETEHLPLLYDYIGDEDYHARIVATKCAARFLPDLDTGRLLALLQEQRAKEDSLRVTEAMDALIAQICSLQQA